MDTEFTPLASLAGGAMIGLAAVLYLLVNGRIAGVAGIAASLLPPTVIRPWPRIAFLSGLVAAPALLAALGLRQPFHLEAGSPVLIVAGLLVGAGTVIGSGCTSGHGVCGLGRLSPRSAVAVAVFMTTAALTVFAVRHLL